MYLRKSSINIVFVLLALEKLKIRKIDTVVSYFCFWKMSLNILSEREQCYSLGVFVTIFVLLFPKWILLYDRTIVETESNIVYRSTMVLAYYSSKCSSVSKTVPPQICRSKMIKSLSTDRFRYFGVIKRPVLLLMLFLIKNQVPRIWNFDFKHGNFTYFRIEDTKFL